MRSVCFSLLLLVNTVKSHDQTLSALQLQTPNLIYWDTLRLCVTSAIWSEETASDADSLLLAR